MSADSIVSLSASITGTNESVDALLQLVLGILRDHLDMQVCFLSEFRGGRRYFRFVDAIEVDATPKPGESDRLEDSYCQRVIDGRLPQLMQDAGRNAEALKLFATKALPVGAHLSVPIRLSTGRLYGTLCCFSKEPDFLLNERDLKVMRAIGAIVSELLSRSAERGEHQDEKRDRIHEVIGSAAFEPNYQPIYRVKDGTLVGFEALTRFTGKPYQSPDIWLRAASEVGLATELEYAMAQSALRGLSRLPSATTLAINLSPEALMSSELPNLLGLMPLKRLVIELTEHAAVTDYAALNAVLGPYRSQGLRIAADDAGAGYSCFRHVLEIRPDLIKLDLSLTRDIDKDPSRAALASALTMFGRSTKAEIVAEGVETLSELETMRRIGVTKVQGYLLGKPEPLSIARTMPISAPIALNATHLVPSSPGLAVVSAIAQATR